MFKRLLFGNEESKLKFKTSTTFGIARLFTDPNIPTSDSNYWQRYLELFDSPSDVFSLLSVSDVRRALITHPENVATLVKVLVTHLQSLQHDAEFSPIPSTSSEAVTSLTAGFSNWVPGLAGKASQIEKDMANTRNRTREALNCCRILARVIPIIMEGDHDSSCNVQADGSSYQSGSLNTDDFENQLLWTRSDDVLQEPLLFGNDDSITRLRSNDKQENQFVIAEEEEDDDDDDGNKSRSADPLGTNQHVKNQSTIKDAGEGLQVPALGHRLTSIILDLLFYSGFTIPWTEEKKKSPLSAPVATTRIHYSIWEKGIGSSVGLPGTTKAHESNRVEVLRLLLVMFSKSIYIPAHLQTSSDNLSLRMVTTSLERSKVLPLLCSLINVSIARIKADGWLGGLATLPAEIVKDRLTNAVEDVRNSTTMLSLQILNVLLGYEQPKNDGEIAENLSETPLLGTPRPVFNSSASFASIHSVKTIDSERPANLFKIYLSKLHRQPDFQLLAEGIFAIISQRLTLSPASLLNPSVNATDTSSAGSHIPEALMLLWKLLTHNSKFRNFLLDDTDRSPQLLGHLLYHALNNKDSAARQGLVRLAIFILHDISCDRFFAVNICKAGSGAKAKITGSQRWGIATSGGSVSLSVVGNGTLSNQGQSSTGADVLIQATYSLIASTKSTLAALYPPLIITLTNLSPFFKNLSILSSNRLLALFSSFSNPNFVLADEGNPRLLYYLLETFNLTIQHGFNRNPNFIYAIIRQHRQVESLANFTLRRGIAEMRRVRRRAGVENSLGGTVPLLASTPRSEAFPSTTPRTEMFPPTPIVEKPNGANDILEDTLHQNEEEQQQQQQQTKQEESLPNAEMGGSTTTSEKARGKMRRTSTSSEATARGFEQEDEEDRIVAEFNEEELWYAASTIGRNGFVPTQAWVTSWQKALPLDTLQLTLLELVPRVQDFSSGIASKSDADDRILAFLREQTLNDVLPAAPPIQPRSFRWTPQVSIWLLSYLWGLIYLNSSLPFGLFVGSNARLFQIRIQDGVPRRSEHLALANVGNMVFGGLSSVLGLNSASPRQT